MGKRNYNRNKRSTASTNKFSSGENPKQYLLSEQIAKDIGSLNWEYPIGLGYPGFSTPPTLFSGYSVPLVAQLQYQPTFGLPKSVDSASAQAARILYNHIIRINVKSANYDAPDLQAYIISMTSIESFISWCKRLYRILNTFSVSNRKVGEALMAANGVDYGDLMKNITSFRGWLNIYIHKYAQLSFPKEFSLLTRYQTLNEMVFSDENNNSGKEQLYIFVPRCWYAWDETSLNTGTALFPIPRMYKLKSSYSKENLYSQSQISSSTAVTEPWQSITTGSGYNDFKRIQEIGDSLLKPLLNSDDVTFISGDMLKAYGASSMRLLTEVAEGETQPISYDPQMLMQIENCVVGRGAYYYWRDIDGVGVRGCSYFPTLQADNNSASPYLKMDFTMTMTEGGYYAQSSDWSHSAPAQAINMEIASGQKVLNVHQESVTPDEVMCMTRLIPGMKTKWIKENSLGGEVTSAGSEIVTGCTIYGNSTEIGVVTAMASTSYLKQMINADDTEAIVCSSFFHSFPEMRLYKGGISSSNTNAFRGPIFDIDKWTTISNQELKRLHEVAVLAQFAVPEA